MSSEDGTKMLTLVQNRIERCLSLYMNQNEVVNTLYIQDNIEPHVTELAAEVLIVDEIVCGPFAEKLINQYARGLVAMQQTEVRVWQKLEEENQEFFKAYYLRLMVKGQIVEFNKLLSKQVELMGRFRSAGIASIPMSNGSHISPIQQNLTACRAAENAGPTLRTENLHQPISANLHNLFSNCGSSMQSCVQTAVNMASHSRNVDVDVSANMRLAQNPNRGITHVMDGGMIKSEPGYAGNSSFEFGARNNLVESRSALADASVSSFSSVESNSQPLNETLLDADTSSFGFFGQISQHFGLSDLGADFTNDIYSSPPFVTGDSGNFLDPNEIERLNTAPESLRYQDLGGD